VVSERFSPEIFSTRGTFPFLEVFTRPRRVFQRAPECDPLLSRAKCAHTLRGVNDNEDQQTRAKRRGCSVSQLTASVTIQKCEEKSQEIL
jgi:hypothetical protein